MHSTNLLKVEKSWVEISFQDFIFLANLPLLQLHIKPRKFVYIQLPSCCHEGWMHIFISIQHLLSNRLNFVAAKYSGNIYLVFISLSMCLGWKIPVKKQVMLRGRISNPVLFLNCFCTLFLYIVFVHCVQSLTSTSLFQFHNYRTCRM